MNHDKNGVFTLEYQKERLHKRISNRLSFLLSEHFNREDIVYDIGCGTGEYLKYLQQQGFRVQGIEGTKGISEIADVSIIEHDLTKPLSPPEERGSVMCIEVAEHIPAEFEHQLLKTIDDRVLDDLVLSWAVVGQSGVGHVNCRNKDYVVDTLRNMGYSYNEEASNSWRAQAGKDLFWLQNSLYVFHRT